MRRPLRGPCGKEVSGLQELKTNRKWEGSPTTTSKYAQPQKPEKGAESSPGKECKPVNTLLQPCETLRKEQASHGWTHHHGNCEKRNAHCLKPLNLWYSRHRRQQIKINK